MHTILCTPYHVNFSCSSYHVQHFMNTISCRTLHDTITCNNFVFTISCTPFHLHHFMEPFHFHNILFSITPFDMSHKPIHERHNLDVTTRYHTYTLLRKGWGNLIDYLLLLNWRLHGYCHLVGQGRSLYWLLAGRLSHVAGLYWLLADFCSLALRNQLDSHGCHVTQTTSQ